MGFFEKLGEGLRKTRDSVFGSIADLVTVSEITEDTYDELEEQLILADVGADTAVRLVEQLREAVRRNHLKTGEQALDALKGIVREMLRAEEPMRLDGRPAVILVIGVNGVGKTTSIAKLARRCCWPRAIRSAPPPPSSSVSGPSARGCPSSGTVRGPTPPP